MASRRPRVDQGKGEDMPATERGTEISEEVLHAVQKGQQVALEAVRRFVETVNEALPPSAASTKRQEVIDSAFQMTDRLVAAQYEFIQKVVGSAAKSLSGGEGTSTDKG
jgi:hypothetical protein